MQTTGWPTRTCTECLGGGQTESCCGCLEECDQCGGTGQVDEWTCGACECCPVWRENKDALYDELCEACFLRLDVAETVKEVG